MVSHVEHERARFAPTDSAAAAPIVAMLGNLGLSTPPASSPLEETDREQDGPGEERSQVLENGGGRGEHEHEPEQEDSRDEGMFELMACYIARDIEVGFGRQPQYEEEGADEDDEEPAGHGFFPSLQQHGAEVGEDEEEPAQHGFFPSLQLQYEAEVAEDDDEEEPVEQGSPPSLLQCGAEVAENEEEPVGEESPPSLQQHLQVPSAVHGDYHHHHQEHGGQGQIQQQDTEDYGHEGPAQQQGMADNQYEGQGQQEDGQDNGHGDGWGQQQDEEDTGHDEGQAEQQDGEDNGHEGGERQPQPQFQLHLQPDFQPHLQQHSEQQQPQPQHWGQHQDQQQHDHDHHYQQEAQFLPELKYHPYPNPHHQQEFQPLPELQYHPHPQPQLQQGGHETWPYYETQPQPYPGNQGWEAAGGGMARAGQQPCAACRSLFIQLSCWLRQGLAAADEWAKGNRGEVMAMLAGEKNEAAVDEGFDMMDWEPVGSGMMEETLYSGGGDPMVIDQCW